VNPYAYPSSLCVGGHAARLERFDRLRQDSPDGVTAVNANVETKYTKVVKEEDEAKNSDQEARDQQRGERFRKADEDCGVGASHQGSDEDRKQGEGRRRRLGGLVARSTPWI
jgi:hypothetical protein